jgi:hypothetical protein
MPMSPSAARFRTADTDRRGGVTRPAGSISHHRCARFRTQRGRRRTHFEVSGTSPNKETARHDQAEWKDRRDHRRRYWHRPRGRKRFIEEGAFVFIFGRRQEALDAAVADLGPNARAVKGSVSDEADLDRLYAAVKAERGTLDIVFANAGAGSQLRSARSPPSTSTKPSTPM